MATNVAETSGGVRIPDSRSNPLLNRRRFLQGAAAIGLNLARPVISPDSVGANAPSANAELMELPSETAFLMGPGNAKIPGTNLHEYGTYAILPQGTPIQFNGEFGDFVRGKATYQKEKDGKSEDVTKNGFVYKGSIASVPDGLKELTIEQVPWVKTPLVDKKGLAVAPGNPTPTEVTPYYRTVENTDAQVDVKMTTKGSVTENDLVGLMIHNPEETWNQLYSFLNVIKRDGYWALNHQQGDQWEEIAQLAGADSLDATLRISKDGTTVSVKQGDTTSDPITLSVPLYTSTRVLDFFVINTPADTSLTVDQLDYLTPPSGKYTPEK